MEQNDSNYNIKNEELPANLVPKKSKKPFILIGIIGAVILITAIVLIIIFATRKNDNKRISRYSYNDKAKETLKVQSIEMFIEGNEESKKNRFLQGSEKKVQILGSNFNELNPNDTIIIINGKNYDFEKYISVKENKPMKVEIQFTQNISTFKEMFKGCDRIKNITFKDVQTEDISDASSMFEGCTNLNLIQFDNMDSYKITNASKMFKGCSNLDKIEIKNFSTEKVKDMSQMFDGCSNFENNTFVEGLSTKNAELMNEIFSGCSKITSLNLSKFETSKVKNMSGMFKDMNSLKELEINSFKTEKVEYMNEMFEKCSSIKKLNLSNFNTNKVVNMEKMFSSCSELEAIDLSSFDLKNCRNTNDMFFNTKDILLLSITNPNIINKIGTPFNQSIELIIEGNKQNIEKRNLEVEKLQILGDSFLELNSSNAIIYINGRKVNYSNIIDYPLNKTNKVEIRFLRNLTTFKEMFKGCDKIKNITLKNIQTENIFDASSMFEDCTNLNVVQFDNMAISNIINSSKLFKSCSSLNNIKIDKFLTEKVKDMSQMFDGCSNFDNNTFIEGLSTKNVENMNEIFSGCSKIKSLNLSKFETSNIKNMSGMFKNMTSLEELEINSFNTEKVEYMNEMFQHCSLLKKLNLSNFNTTNVINMDKMFSSCSNLDDLNISSFNLTKCKSNKNMFENTKELLLLTLDNKEIMNLLGMPSKIQTIKLSIEQNELKMRNLQEEKIQIFGNSFNDLNISNSIIYIDGKRTDFDKFVAIESNNPTQIEIRFLRNISTFKEMFKQCDKIKDITLNNIQTENILDTSSMFEGCTNLNGIQFDNMDLSNIINTSKMFKGCSKLNKVLAEKFSTEKVKDMSQMFDGCSNFDNNTFIEGLSTKNVESMNEIFSGCSKIKSLNLSKFDTSNIKNMSGMFKNMTSLEDLEINSFNTENVEYMNEMFENCILLKKLNLSNFNTRNVKNMDKMFSSCLNLDDLDISSFELTNCNSTENMIQNTKEILKLVIENEEIRNRLGLPKSTQNIELLVEGNKNNSELRNLQETEERVKVFGDEFKELDPDNAVIYMDGKRVSFNQYLSIKSKSSVKIVIKFVQKLATFREMFSGCQRIKEVTLKDIETEYILETTSMFESCTSLSEVKFENMNFNKITSTAKMFQKCSSLNKIEIEDFSTEETKDMSKMFDGCSSLDNSIFIESLSTKNTETMEEMFSGCSSIKSLDLSGFDTSNVKNMSGMFKGMTGLEQLEIGSFHTEKVEYMSEMFENCSSIVSLDLSNFNTEMVINMDRMFSSCLNLETVDLSSFTLTNCNSTESMFSNTTRQLMISIEQNKEVMIKAGFSWTEPDGNITKLPLDILFLVDATGSMMGAIERVKENIIYIAVNLMNKTNMDIYDLSLAAIFYRDPIDSPDDYHEIFDFDRNALNFRTFVENIEAIGGADGPEDWAGAFNLSNNLTWRNDSFKFIIHIADAPAHGLDWTGGYDNYPSEGNRTDEIITYFAKNNFSVAGFLVDDLYYSIPSYIRAQKLFRENGNLKYFKNLFTTYDPMRDYFLDLVYDSFQYVLNAKLLQGIDVNEEFGNINWKKVKEKNKIDFALIRAGIGNNIDKMFEENYNGAKKSGIPIGVYWVSNSTNMSESDIECKLYSEILEGKQIEFPIYYILEQNGFEEEWDGIICSFDKMFNSKIYLRGIRSTQERITNYFYNDEFEGNQIWMSNVIESYPELNLDANVWNYNNFGKIDGIEGNVPLVKSILDYTKITLNNNFNGY